MPVLNPQGLVQNRVACIRSYHSTTDISRAELDVSGGVDSAVMLGILSKALGPENITAVYQGIHSNPDSLSRAREVADTFGVKLIEIDLTSIFEHLLHLMKGAIVASMCKDAQNFPEQILKDLEDKMDYDPLILGSLRSCIRAPIGRGFNRMMGGGIRHGTGNECEDRWTRFYQKGGDGEVDTNPLAMLSKGEVYQLALALKVPRSIVEARPSPDLWGEGDAHNDEDEFSNYFGLDLPEGCTFYSYVNPDTGRYTHVGLIERVSRLLDVVGESLFQSNGEDVADYLGGIETEAFRGSGLSSDFIRSLLLAARRIERQTRHKMNPNCPILGNRSSLVDAGILTNFLSEE